jgi:hypothetical protein
MPQQMKLRGNIHLSNSPNPSHTKVEDDSATLATGTQDPRQLLLSIRYKDASRAHPLRSVERVQPASTKASHLVRVQAKG